MISKKIFILIQMITGLFIFIGCSEISETQSHDEKTQIPVVTDQSMCIITFDSKGLSSNPAPMILPKYSTLKLSELPRLNVANHSFLGWSYKDKKICDEYMVDRNITLEATWAKKEYTITYFDENELVFSGTFNKNHPVKYRVEEDTALVGATKIGFEFNGWYMNKSCAGEQLTKLDKGLYTQDIKLYAKWIPTDCIRNVVAVEIADMIKNLPDGKVNYLKVEGAITDEIITQIKKALINNPSKMISFDFTCVEGLTQIGYCAFASCRNLVNVKLPDTVTKICERGFVQCSGLKSISLGNSVIEIGEKAFGECSSLVAIAIPDTTQSIGKEAFILCKKLESIKFGKSVKEIGEYAFSECKLLKIIELPDLLEKISMGLFYGCSDLEKVIIPQNAKEMGCNVFGECTKLKSLVFLGQDCDFWFRSDVPNEGGYGFEVHDLTVEHFIGDFEFYYWYKS